jgi:hypothetical protein
LRALKLGTRVMETTSRVGLAFAAACPEAASEWQNAVAAA